jgi:hypothetical protein
MLLHVEAEHREERNEHSAPSLCTGKTGRNRALLYKGKEDSFTVNA